MTAGLVLCAGMLAAAAVPFGGDAPFRAWDNYGDCNATTCAPGQYGIGQANRAQTGGGCGTNICSSWSQGAFPRMDGKTPVNGGIPQKGNLTLQLQKNTRRHKNQTHTTPICSNGTHLPGVSKIPNLKQSSARKK
ncbi:hypothetical protein DIPPA_27855 [Diplonema papillatum]|nr:hypothetical protein DIPPA_27855 [Diplonema papillatum]